MISRFAVTLAGALALGGGCVDDYGSFYISKTLVPGTGCTPPSASSVYLSAGLFDVSGLCGAAGYMIWANVENQLAATKSGTEAERNNIQLREFRVSIDLGPQIPPMGFGDADLHYSVRTSGVITPGGTSVVPFEAISQSLATKLGQVPNIQDPFRPQIVVEFRAAGVRSGSDMESGPYQFPVTICRGCLVKQSAASCYDLLHPDPKNPTPPVYTTNVCGLPQDSPVTSCSGTGGLTCLMTE